MGVKWNGYIRMKTDIWEYDVCINVKTRKIMIKLLEFLNNLNYKWIGGKKINIEKDKITDWEYKTNTTIRIEFKDKEIAYGSKEFYKKYNCKVIPFKSINQIKKLLLIKFLELGDKND